ncbi:MAG TPA: FtsX-like permease family protein, partial [Mycobacteriales bacterium]|nr:FtsX-like permease family protein [Mycobacteriales bacterium]
GIILLPPWTRAPLLPFRQPAVILAVLGAAAILACASASAALFLSSASSASLQRLVAAECPDATAATVRVDLAAGERPPDGAAAQRALTGQGFAPPAGVFYDGQARPATSATDTKLVRTFYGSAALDNVTRLAGDRAARGVWVSRSTATQLGVRPGDRVSFGGAGPFGDRPPASVRVAGIYQNLYDEPVRRYWCSYAPLFQNLGSASNSPPELVIATDPATFESIPAFRPTYSWASPVDTAGLTLAEGRDIASRQAGAYRAAGVRQPTDFASQNSGPGQMPALVERTALIRDGLRGPVLPIALGGSLLALLLVGAAGSYWADRRRSEVRLLSARGVGPGALAAKAVLELAVPALVGTVAGWALARWLVTRLGPSPDLDASAPLQAASTAALALACGLALLGLVAGLRSRAATERPVGARRSRLGSVPWELALLAGSAGCYAALRSGRAVVIEQNVAQINLLVVAFPLLFLVGAAVLIVRLLALLLPRVSRAAGQLSPAWYLAARRVTASRVVSVLLLAAASAPIAMTVYASALTRTSQYTLDAKAKLFVGSDAAVVSLDPLRRTPQTDRAGTLVTRYLYATTGDGTEVALLAIDPDTFAATAFWDGRFATESLPALLARLRGRASGGRVPAILVDPGPLGDRFDVTLGKTTARVDVVAGATWFPGRRLPKPVVVVDAGRLGRVDRFAGTTNELWSRDVAAARAAVLGQQARIWDVANRNSVFQAADFLGVSWTFGYLTALAALVGLVAIGGLLLYLETRQRSRTASYALGRRMGLSRGTHLRSLLAELGVLLGAAFVVGAGLAWTAVLMVYGRLDIDPSRPPTPLLTVPGAALVGAAAAAVAVTVLASLYAQRSADRADVAEVLRLGS